MIAEKMGFDGCYPVSGQTYSRKLDTRVLNVLAGIAQSAHKFSNDIRLLQHLKEVEEPFREEPDRFLRYGIQEKPDEKRAYCFPG